MTNNQTMLAKTYSTGFINKQFKQYFPKHASEIIAEYDVVILNRLLGDSQHWDFDNTQIAINESKILNPNVEIFGKLYCSDGNILS